MTISLTFWPQKLRIIADGSNNWSFQSIKIKSSEGTCAYIVQQNGTTGCDYDNSTNNYFCAKNYWFDKDHQPATYANAQLEWDVPTLNRRRLPSCNSLRPQSLKVKSSNQSTHLGSQTVF